ncbi:MAG: TonB-dependent receptor plug domain-containing protein [Myxococcales bacterium]
MACSRLAVWALIVVHVSAAGSAVAQEAGDADELLKALEEIDELSLTELLRAETSLVAAMPQTLRASPGILTVVTREEIRASGARDLMDVLRLVPGFGFAQDVQGVVGMGFRGIWGHESRVLLLVDGHEMNELLFQTTQLGNHYPAELIEKVEIIRGPGSAIHGGNAELAVNNVVTRKGAQLSGLEGSVRLGAMSGGGTRRGAALAWGDQVGGGSGVEVSAAAFFGEAARSGYDYTDYRGTRFSLASESALSPAFVKADARWRGLSVSFLYDGYRSLDRVGYGESLSRPVWIGFPGYYASATWKLDATSSLSVTPRVQYKRQAPWRSLDDKPDVMTDSYFDTVAERWSAGLQLEWRPLAGLSLVGGGEARLDHAWVNPDANGEYESGTNVLLSGEPSVRYHNLAAFAQVVWNNPIVNASAGARFERHSYWAMPSCPGSG